MKTFTIRNKYTQKPLYSGKFETIKECLKSAVNKGIKLKDANLKHLNLSGANLDDAHLNGADFSFSNLTGANMSESQLKQTRWRGTSLYNTCFAYSDLSHADLRFSSIGATDLSGAKLTGAILCMNDSSKLNLVETKTMRNCMFEDNDNTQYRSSEPPIVIMGLYEHPTFIINNHIITKGKQFKVENQIKITGKSLAE